MLKKMLIITVSMVMYLSFATYALAEDFDTMWRRGNFYERTKAVLDLHTAGNLSLDTPRTNSWRRAAQKTRHYFTWSERMKLNEVAKALGTSVIVEPDAMDLLNQARGAQAEEALALFDQAWDAGAAFTEADHLIWARMARAAGNLDLARDQLLHMPSNQRSKQGVDIELSELPEPKLRSKIIVHSLLGGAGDQRISKITVHPDGRAVFSGKGFKATFLPETEQIHMDGDISIANEPAKSGSFLAKGWKTTSKEVQVLQDPQREQTYRWFTWQVSKLLQQPYVSSSAGWELWGWSNSEAEKANLMADSRICRIWLRPDGLLGGLGWTDGGNTVFAKHPTNLGRRGAMGGFGKGARSVMFTLDPDNEGAVVASRTFNGTVPNHYADPWGRLILGGPRFSRRAGYAVLDTKFKPIAGGALGASEAKGVRSAIATMVQAGPYLFLGGSSNAPKIKGKSMLQKRSGGGHDALVAVIKLW